MTQSVRFAPPPTLHSYEPHTMEHQTPKDLKSEALIISAASLAEKTAHLWDIHQRMLQDPASIFKELPNQPVYTQLHEELDDTINGLHLLKKSKYPEPERFEDLYSTLLSHHESIHEIKYRLECVTHAKKLTQQAIKLVEAHRAMHLEYTQEIKPLGTFLEQEFIDHYIQEATRQQALGKKIAHRLGKLTSLHLENETTIQESSRKLEAFQRFLTRVISHMEWVKDIKYIQASKQLVSPLPMGTLHEVESKEPGVKRFRFAGLY